MHSWREDATALAPQPAVSVGAGAIWMHVYDAVTTRAGRYVQGGGCTTVGVAGLIQSGGFGTFSKNYGTAAGSLLEAEIVTADGAVRIVNACSDPELFWGIKGGGGGSFGVDHAPHAENARTAGLVRRRVHDDRGGIGCRVPPPGRRVHRSVSQPAVQSRTGARACEFRPTTRWRSR